MPAQTRSKKTLIHPVKSHIPPRPTPPLPPLPLRAVPKGPIPAGMTLEEKAARYDQMLSTRKQKRSIKREISKLYRDMDNLEAEETRILDQDIAANYGEAVGASEPCPGCGFERCNCENVTLA